MRRFVALISGLPTTESATWRPERARPATAVEPERALRKVSPLEAMSMVKGGRNG